MPTNPAAQDVQRVELRQTADFITFSRWFLAFAIVFLTAWCVLLIVVGAWFWTPIGIGMAVAFTVMHRRLERLAVVADGDELIITNMLRTRRIDRREIRWFSGGRRHLDVELADRLAAGCNLFAVNGFGARSDAKACAEQLNAWLGHERGLEAP